MKAKKRYSDARLPGGRRVMVYRNCPLPLDTLPLPVRSAGMHAVTPVHAEPAAVKNILQVFWCAQGAGELRGEDFAFRLRKDEVAFLLPGDTHDLHALEGPWIYEWFTVDGSAAGPLIRGMRLERGSLNAGACPSPLFARLREEIRDFSPAGQCTASATAYTILMKALRGRIPTLHPLVVGFRELVALRYADPDFFPSIAAEALHTHRATLNRVFQTRTGISPGTYLQQYRIQQALHLLQNTGLPVADIAAQTGFRDPAYLARVVRRATGLSPLRYRAAV